MNNAIYTALSRQAGLSKELTSIANNIANADTTGFRREGFLFSEYVRLLEPQDDSLSQTSIGGHFLDSKTGPLHKTGSKFDVAIEGEGFFVVQTPRGERLTRAGAFGLNAEGQMVTPQGYAVLGEGGTPIAIPPEARTVSIASDGTIAADGAPVGKIAIATAPPTALAREGATLFRSTQDYEFVETPRLAQGFLEDSNVNAVIEMSRLIEVQRAYELGQQLLRDEDERISKTIETMGRR